jgi:hypothetical protein
MYDEVSVTGGRCEVTGCSNDGLMLGFVAGRVLECLSVICNASYHILLLLLHYLVIEL